MNEMQYRDFSEQVHIRASDQNVPLKGQMELTFRCNLKCVHCYVSEDRDKTELSFQDITGILDQISQEGCLWLTFTGGEPLVREDFLEIYRYAKNKGLLITLMTNGTKITQEMAELLADLPPFLIELSLNGVTKNTYESISQVPGSFQKIMKAIDVILKKGLPLKIKTKLTRMNVHEAAKIKQFVESLGMVFRPDVILYPRLDGSLHPCRYRLQIDDILSLDNRSEERHIFQELLSDKEENTPPDRLFRCAAGIHSFHINPYGELMFCTFMRRPSFQLKNRAFKEGCDTLFPEIRSLVFQTQSQCRDCVLSSLCPQCAGLAFLENRDMEKPISYFCELTHRLAGIPFEHTG